MIALAVLIIGSYLLGSIPPAYILTRLVRGADIRDLGSGNSGATNAFRVLGWKGALPVFLFDFFKGFAPAWWVLHASAGFALPAALPVSLAAILAGTAAFAGHLFPVYIGFRGGKGVATGAGVLTALCPPLAGCCFAVFIAMAALTRKISAASIIAAVSAPLWYLGIVRLRGTGPDLYLLSFMLIISVSVPVTHRKNIRDLLCGKEKTIV